MFENAFPILFILALFAVITRLLSFVGAFTALLVGLAILMTAGWQGLVLMFLFFLTSSFFSRFGGKQKQKLKGVIEKSGKRDALQVLANGFPALSFSILYYFADLNFKPLMLIGFVGAIASANADTLATEIGCLSKPKPLSVMSLKKVDKGISGGVSIAGFFGSVLGGLVIAFPSIFLFDLLWLESLVAILFGGFFGAFIDSMQGELLQSLYYCQKCRKYCEMPLHVCGRKAKQVKGIAFVDNDFVNLTSNFAGAIAAIIAFAAMSLLTYLA